MWCKAKPTLGYCRAYLREVELANHFATGPLTALFMSSLVYVRLIGFTAGTLLQLFWMVVILGYRRQRNFERVFFFLSLALFLFYSGSLLALNAQIYYSQPPLGLQEFAIAITTT